MATAAINAKAAALAPIATPVIPIDRPTSSINSAPKMPPTI